MMDVPGAAPDLVELLEHRAATSAPEVGFTFLVDGEHQEAHVSFVDLRRNAHAIAALLQSKVPAGARVVLLYPPGLDYISAFFGCLYGGFVAVPAYPPNPARLQRTLPRLQAIVHDADADIVLTTSAISAMTGALAALAPDLGRKTWLATDALATGLEGAWRRPAIAPETLAFLQYTSGSTGSPKGVMLTHGNLIANQAMIRAVFGLSSRSVGVGWLPLYHDMGLIGNVLQPIYAGFRFVLMSPLHFLARPMRWLEAISRYGGTASGGPNFAYDLCVRKIAPEERERLDLRTWEVAFTGAEPVRAETMDLFAGAFAGCGFTRKAFLPCFGLAEASLLVSGKSTAGDAQVRQLDPRALEQGRAVASPPSVPARALVGAGPAAPGTRVVIVDPVTHRPQPDGQVGEVWITGPHVAIGYWADAAKTEATFGAQLAGDPGARFLRSGDLAFLEGDELYICGRLKDLIILRGRNYYPQDFERSAETAHPSLRRGCAAAFSVDVDGEERLIIAVEVEHVSQPAAEDGFAAIFGAIRRDIAASFDVHVHAIALVAAGAIPKTSSGKIQRRACRDMFLQGSLDVVRATRDPDGSEPEAGDAPAEVRLAPAGERLALVEGFVRSELARALRVRREHVDMTAAVSGLGLDSLMAVEISHRVTEQLGVALPVAALLGDGSAIDLAARIHAMIAAAPAAAAPTTTAAPERAALAQDVFPVSTGQESMWFLQQLAPDSSAYNLATALRLAGDFSPPVLERALRQLVARHPVLHTTYAEVDGRPMQQLRPELVDAFVLDVVDASTWSDAELDARVREAAARPFDLAVGPVLRASLFARSARDATLVLAAHHIATDLWSIVILLSELRSSYPALRAGRDLAPPVATGPSYRAFVEWQRDYLATRGEADAAYWQAQLADAGPLELPYDHRRPAIQTARGAVHRTRIEPALVAGIAELARREGVTPYVILLSAFEILLARYSGQSSFVVGTPVVGRPAAPFARVVGYFVNSLPLRADLSGNPSVGELIQRVRSTVLGALEHQHYPFMLTVKRSTEPRDPSRSPVFQVMFVLERAFLDEEADTMMLVLGAAGPPARLGGFELWPHPLPRASAQYDLTLSVAHAGAEMAASFEYHTDLFERETIERMAAQFAVLLRGLVARSTGQVADLAVPPDPRALQMPLWGADERRRILHDWNDTAVAYPDARGLHQLFEAQVDRTPGAVAVRFAGTAMTYAALSERSNQIAHHLIGLGIGRGARVAVSLPRSPELLASLLGVLATGAAYVPLDPRYPRARLAFLLADAAPAALITESADAAIPPGTLVVRPAAIARSAAGAASKLAAEVAPDDPAYLMYTSGSSGQPKAAIISHAALGNYLRWCVEAYDVARGAGAVVSTSVAFDATVTTLFPPLLVGRAVVMVPEHGDGHGDELAELAALVASGEPLGPLKLTPAHIDALRATDVAPRPGRVHTIVVGGEQLLGEHVAWCRAAAPEARIFNEYGPTETTVGCSIYEVPPGPVPAVVPIGRPIANTRLYVLDAHLAAVPIGVTGELYIGGAGVAQGYHARPELTAERFIDDPFSPAPGARLYRTGDLAAYLPDGNLRFLGRRDGQVKLRGFRIELAEIEAVLARHAAVGHAAVVVQRSASGDPRLVAFVVAARGAPAAPTTEALRQHLVDELPDHMVPSIITVVPELPLTPNGKVDRGALPAAITAAPGSYTAPATALQEAMCEIAAELLDVPRVGIHDNFFELGGHSLLATQFVSRVRKQLHIDLTVRFVFQHPTIAQQATALASIDEQAEHARRSAPIRRISRDGRLPASPMQQRIFAIDRASSGSSLYNVPAALKLRGELDRSALARAIEDLVRRHEALRTIFALGPGGASQIIQPPTTWSIPIEDLGALTGETGVAAVNRIVREEALRPFDLTRGPLLRTRLLRIADDEHVFLLTMHHIISDGWSMATIASELSTLYNTHRAGSQPVLSPLEVQYVDFVAWQRQWLSGAVLERELGFWVQQLKDAPVLELPLDRPRPAQPTFHGKYLVFALDAERSAALDRLSSAQGATLFMTLLAIFQVLLYTYSGQGDLCVATSIAGRTRAELEGLIGFFINRLILRARVSNKETFLSLLEQVRDTSLASYTHQDVPFDLIVEALGINTHPSLSPLCQAMFVLQNMPSSKIRLDGLEVELLELETDTSKFDLALVMAAGPAGLTGRFEYKTALFDEATIAGMVRRFERLVQVIVRDPEVSLQRLRAASERGISSTLAT